jgi:hypothetical protein
MGRNALTKQGGDTYNHSVASDYSEYLDAASLRLLAETTGFASGDDANQAFSSRPHDISVALGSPEAARLLDMAYPPGPVQHRLLQLAVAVHQTAEDICQAGWVATNESIIDLNLLSFSGQSQHQQFVVGLLASYLNSPMPVEFMDIAPSPAACNTARLYSLIDLCATASDTERAGALRLLGDEALFTTSLFPSIAHNSPVDLAMLNKLKSVLPRAVVTLMDELEPQLRTLLDVYLMFGPVWYRMAAQNLLFSGARELLNSIAADFITARRFIVQVSQGPMVNIKHELYPEIV